MAEEFDRLDKDKKGELDAQELLLRSNLVVKHARPEDVAGAWSVRRIVAVTEGRISECTAEIVWQSSTWSMWWGFSLIVSGMLGGSLLLERVPVNLVIAWLIVLAGMVHLIIAHHAHRAGSLIWRLMIGFAHVFFGVYLIASPVLGEALLALVLASLFLFEGVLDIAMFLRLRAIDGSSWILLDGIVTLILGLMSYMRWPSTAAWAIGVLVSVSLVTSGLTRVMFSMAVRKSITLGPGRTKQDDSSAKDYWSVHQ
jgi:uncharacterized membrane protein HdeD (DUF308 family)